MYAHFIRQANKLPLMLLGIALRRKQPNSTPLQFTSYKAWVNHFNSPIV